MAFGLFSLKKKKRKICIFIYIVFEWKSTMVSNVMIVVNGNHIEASSCLQQDKRFWEINHLQNSLLQKYIIIFLNYAKKKNNSKDLFDCTKDQITMDITTFYHHTCHFINAHQIYRKLFFQSVSIYLFYFNLIQNLQVKKLF